MKKYAIIVAGGKGNRMGETTPKQFLLLAGKPILMRTIEAFYTASSQIELIVVLPSKDVELWNSLIQKYAFKINHKTVPGGDTRFHSVQNGLGHVHDNSLVAIHDGVRPLISAKIINLAYVDASKYGNAIASVKLKDSLRKIDINSNCSVNREDYRLIQTPQTFKSSSIIDAFNQVIDTNFTDDAGVLESLGGSIHLIDGDYHNIKITTKDDLVLAEAYFNEAKKLRVSKTDQGI
ncbi:MAG: 2-C-methyl-D-erythritol 4-phosphate cytidylyltransferase [Cyclobacteriaceae bacterium]|nr:2-C-methyl-D-erythritol 4-phosphate cytidylyltransferase [Cyclobacteriaceae bacterium]